jgi:hypothetical protein
MEATASKVHCYEDKSPGAWDEFIKAMHSGQVFECDEEMYYYWLEVLPPAYMGKNVVLPDGQKVRAHFGFAEGADYITAFWMIGSERLVERPEGGVLCSIHRAASPESRFFGCRTNEMNPYA